MLKNNNKIEKVKIENLTVSTITKKLYDYSNRESEIRSLERSIKEIGQRKPIIVIFNGTKYIIIDGVLRYFVFKRLKLNKIDVIVDDFEPTSEFTLEDFIIHHQIQKQKTEKEIVNEIRELLRIGQPKSGQPRDKEQRVQLISELLGGKGWKRNNVYNLEKLIKWCDENKEYSYLVEKVITGEISISKGLSVIEIFERDDYNHEKENESNIVKKFIDGSYDKVKVNNLITSYNTKKDTPSTEIKIGQYTSDKYTIIQGNSLTKELPKDVKVDLSFTSIPYYRQVKYGDSKDEIGWEKTPQEYVSKIVSVFKNKYENIKDTGSVIINVNESYKNGECVGIVPLLIEGFKKNGFIYVQQCIWFKNDNKPMGNNVKRFLSSYEYILIFSKSKEYYFERIRIKDESKKLEVKKGCKEQGGKKPSFHISNNYRQIRDFVTENVIGDIIKLNITDERSQTKNNKSDFFGSFPNNFPLPYILSFCPEGGTVWDPFTGTGTVGRQSLILGRRFVGHELYEKNIPLLMETLKKGETGFDKESLIKLNQELGLSGNHENGVTYKINENLGMVG